jgi:hypothetical protein
LKENLLWVRTFDTIEELRAALVEFASRYNEPWLVARHGYRTPAKVRADQCRIDQNARQKFPRDPERVRCCHCQGRGTIEGGQQAASAMNI